MPRCILCMWPCSYEHYEPHPLGASLYLVLKAKNYFFTLEASYYYYYYYYYYFRN